ncbi:response regulator transcription factor [Litoribacter ruber]|uniref:Response regulator transcription factor n=1 Tax=Litoribacter ruber TaxID=702568 RepID=A0AAP2CM16_9BACT|nr:MULTISPECIES: response regulator transcription factor [Litoribacter]MBS9524367.1 response regulator transcription factor [Litoribacter alkaliphilus]MBT0809833.1 response regulator transcription factor [Litoribacter ruber]
MIRIVLADDHKMFAKGIAGLLEKDEEIQVDGIFQNGLEVLNHLKEYRPQPHMVLTDLNMPGMDGMNLIKNIRKTCQRCKIIVLSMYDDEEIFKACVKEGIDAYILKDADPDELVYTIYEVVENRHILHYPNVLKQASEEIYLDVYKEKFKLSRRETEILKFIVVEGLANKDIADKLCLSVHTIEAHRKKIHQKLEVNNATELIKKGLEMNL